MEIIIIYQIFDTQARWASRYVSTDGILGSPAIWNSPGAQAQLATQGYWGSWQTDDLLAINSTGSSLLIVNLAMGKVSNAGAFVGNSEFPFKGVKKNAGLFHFGTENPGNPYARPSTSLFLESPLNKIAPETISGVTFDFIYSLSATGLRTDCVWLFNAPNTNNDVDFHAAVTQYSTIDGRLLNAKIVDVSLANAPNQPAPDTLRQQSMIVSPDAQSLFYYKVFAVPEPPNLFYNDRWVVKLDANSLNVIQQSETPFQTGAYLTEPWASGNGMPVGPFNMSVSQDGRYFYAGFPHSTNSDLPIVLWDTQNQIFYGRIEDCAVPAGNYKWEQSTSVWDNNNKLWIFVPNAPNASLIRFDVSSGIPQAELSVSIPDSSDSAVGILFKKTVPTVSVESPILVPLPFPRYAQSQRLAFYPWGFYP